MKLKKKEFSEWKHHKGTEDVFAYLRDLREVMKEELARGSYTHDSVEATALSHADVVGRCEAINELLNLSYEDMQEFYGVEETEDKEAA